MYIYIYIRVALSSVGVVCDYRLVVRLQTTPVPHWLILSLRIIKILPFIALKLFWALYVYLMKLLLILLIWYSLILKFGPPPWLLKSKTFTGTPPEF